MLPCAKMPRRHILVRLVPCPVTRGGRMARVAVALLVVALVGVAAVAFAQEGGEVSRPMRAPLCRRRPHTRCTNYVAGCIARGDASCFLAVTCMRARRQSLCVGACAPLTSAVLGAVTDAPTLLVPRLILRRAPTLNTHGDAVSC